MSLNGKTTVFLGISLSVCLSPMLGAQGLPGTPAEVPSQKEKTEPRKPREAKPRPTAEEVSKKLSDGQQIKIKKKKELEAEKKSKRTEPPTLNSVFLVDSNVSTKVPANCVIFVPDNLKGKVSSKIKGTLVPWRRFYSRNMNSIHLYAVNIQQARGNAKIKQEQIKQFKKLGKIVIATHDGGLISVNPEALKPEKKEDAADSKPE